MSARCLRCGYKAEDHPAPISPPTLSGETVCLVFQDVRDASVQARPARHYVVAMEPGSGSYWELTLDDGTVVTLTSMLLRDSLNRAFPG